MADANARSATHAYSLADRLLHRMAFAHPFVQRALGEMESDVFARKYENVAVRNPVFVTGLPRSGTTLLLEMLYGTGEFASFTYRDMPFVLAPLFWAQLTGSFQKSGAAKERAHGDGVAISYDSPEAFEEILWVAYLGERFLREDRVSPIGPDAIDAEFRSAFAALIRKLVALRSDAAPKRYLSKNNANISRIDCLRALFADATIFVCLREPVSHVASLMTQHRRFLAMHEEDPFARDYMKWIGHYDFGGNFRPIDFAGAEKPSSPQSADFWLQYWIDAYSYAERRLGDGVHVFCYEQLFGDAQEALSRAARAADLQRADAFIANAARIRPPTTQPTDIAGVDAALVAQASALYRRLADSPRRAT